MKESHFIAVLRCSHQDNSPTWRADRRTTDGPCRSSNDIDQEPQSQRPTGQYLPISVRGPIAWLLLSPAPLGLKIDSEYSPNCSLDSGMSFRIIFCSKTDSECSLKTRTAALCLFGFSVAKTIGPGHPLKRLCIVHMVFRFSCRSNIDSEYSLDLNTYGACLSEFSTAQKSARNIFSNYTQTTICLFEFADAQNSARNVFSNALQTSHVCLVSSAQISALYSSSNVVSAHMSVRAGLPKKRLPKGICLFESFPFSKRCTPMLRRRPSSKKELW